VECGQWDGHSVRLLLVGQMFWHTSGERFVAAQVFINSFSNTAVWEVKCQLLTASMIDICLPAPLHLCQWQTCLICTYAATICLWTLRCSVFCAQRIWITAYTSFLVHQFSSSVKGKAIPLQAWTGPEGSRLRLPDFKTIGTWRW